jgi:hypothetical protein
MVNKVASETREKKFGLGFQRAGFEDTKGTYYRFKDIEGTNGLALVGRVGKILFRINPNILLDPETYLRLNMY